MAIGAGMTSAIMNPLHHAEEMTGVRGADVLMGHDAHCAPWIKRKFREPAAGRRCRPGRREPPAAAAAVGGERRRRRRERTVDAPATSPRGGRPGEDVVDSTPAPSPQEAGRGRQLKTLPHPAPRMGRGIFRALESPTSIAGTTVMADVGTATLDHGNGAEMATMPGWCSCRRASAAGSRTGRRSCTAARQLGVDIDSVCGGRGICGRCQVVVSEGEFAKLGVTSNAHHLSDFSAVGAALFRQARH